MKLAPSAFAVALQFLTVLPVTLTGSPAPPAGRSLLAYPWLGGTTGDTAGTLVELTELAVLVTAALAVQPVNS